MYITEHVQQDTPLLVSSHAEHINNEKKSVFK